VILGALPDPQMFRLIERERASQGEEAEMDFPTVMHHIRRTRATGMSAIMKERPMGAYEPRPRVTCWAAVILDERRYPIGAVSAARVGPFLSEADNEKGIAQLFRLSHELTNLFGSDQVVVPPLRADWRILARPRTFGFAN
jgi:DNA-binding IclR family transcriptional regulator